MRGRSPRIGITLRTRGADQRGRGAARADGWWLHDALLQRCADIGALAWPLAAPAGLADAPIAALAQAQIGELDALILAGGGDILLAPASEPPPGADALALTRDRHEYALLAAARARGLPVLGICRGAQLIHRAGGGELLAPDAASEAMHLDVARYVEHHHAIELMPGSWLAASHRGACAIVNSAHRWRIGEALPRTRVLARCVADGSVEAFELADEACVVGLMWHPEFALAHPDALAGDVVFSRLGDAISG